MSTAWVRKIFLREKYPKICKIIHTANFAKEQMDETLEETRQVGKETRLMEKNIAFLNYPDTSCCVCAAMAGYVVCPGQFGEFRFALSVKGPPLCWMMRELIPVG